MHIVRFSIFVVALSVATHAIIARWALRSWPALQTRRAKLWLAAGTLALVILPVVTRIATLATRNAIWEALHAFATVELASAVFAAVPLLVIDLLARLASPKAKSETKNEAVVADAVPEISRRVAIERVGGTVVLATTSATLGWGYLRGRHDYLVREVPVRIAGLPRALDGYTIAQVSDVHVGLFVGERELREGLDFVRAMKPDMVVCTGDMVDFDASYAPMFARALSDLEPRDGVFAILGNHDYYADRNRVIEAIRATKIDLLVNAGRHIRARDGGGFALLGVDDLWSRAYGGEGPNLAHATEMVQADVPRILLAHQPTYFERSSGRVALQLSGHTHGGQIRPADVMMHWVAGRYERDGSTLYVNRGFGVAGPPVRIGVPPEITKIVLVSA